MKTVYIPGFGNSEDDVFQNYLNGKGEVIQLNLRDISPEKLSSFMEGKSFDEISKLLKSHYPNMEESILLKLIGSGNNFKGFTRTVDLTSKLTNKKILNILKGGEKIKIVGHSQGGLITIKTIVDNPNLLNNIIEIELLAPVIDYKTGGDFHSGKESGYLNGKGVIVRPEYIGELKGGNNIFYKLLELLKDTNWSGKLKLVIGKNDKVIPINKFNVKEIKEKYPNIDLQIVKGDHYLGFKK